MRVIQDSDDDLDDDLEADVLPPKDVGASMQDNTNASPQPGTGSTESLKRAFEIAHRTHLQPQQPESIFPVGNEPPSSVSLPEHRIKRRKTSADVSPHRLPSAASIKNGSIDHEKVLNPVLRSPSIDLVEARLQTSQSSEINKEGLWDLKGTMRNDYAQHNSMMMFPDPSSTIPNATFTQQRMLEAVAAPALLGVDAETTASYQPAPSIPWSEYLKLTPGDNGEHLESSNREQHTSQMAPTLTPAVPLVQSPRIVSEIPTSQQSRRGSSIRLRGSPLRSEMHNDVELASVTVPRPEIIPSFQSNTPPMGSIGSHTSTKGELEKLPRRKKSKDSSLSDLDDDDDDDDDAEAAAAAAAVIGFPKEQYNPRPSRSRSLKINVQEPVDYSVRPESAARTRRRKTATGSSNTEKDAAPEKVQQICDMGFSLSATKTALLQNNGDVTQTIEWLVTNHLDHNELDHDELAPQSSPKSKSRLGAKGVLRTKQSESVSQATSVQNEGQEVSRLDMPSNAPIESDKVQVDIGPIVNVDPPPNTTPFDSPKMQGSISEKPPKPDLSQNLGVMKATGKKPKRRKTTLDHPEPTAEEPIVPEVTKGKKRGRGRPKKAANNAISTEPMQGEQEEKTQEEQHTAVLPSTELSTGPHEKQSGRPSSVAQVLNDKRMPQRPEVESFTPPPLSKMALEPTASPTPEKSTKPASHSPINKGKVPYRVGLSKRARIAPLLRILKR